MTNTDYEYWSPKQIATSEKYPFTIGQMRHLLLYRHKNGLENAIRKIGKTILIRIDLFNQWIESKQGDKNG